MQKYICLMIFGLTVCYGANAATMCTASDTVTVVLDPNIAGTGYTQDANLKTWQATFSYGKIYGIASCNKTSGSVGMVNIGTVMSQTDEGQYCWCKMLVPAVSAWVFEDGNSDSASNCAVFCANHCGSYVHRHGSFRQWLFRSAGI